MKSRTRFDFSQSARFGPVADFRDQMARQATGHDSGPFTVAADLDGDHRPEIVLHYTEIIHIYKSEQAAKNPNAPLGTGLNWTMY